MILSVVVIDAIIVVVVVVFVVVSIVVVVPVVFGVVGFIISSFRDDGGSMAWQQYKYNSTGDIFSAFRVSYPDLMMTYHHALFFLIFKARELKIIVIFHQVQKNV